jgi:hypothetical protein
MKRAAILTILGLILVLTVLSHAAPARAQEVTPEPTAVPTATPTPAYLQEKTLSSGNTLLIERSVSYGDIAVVIAVLVLWVTYLVTHFIEIPREFIK